MSSTTAILRRRGNVGWTKGGMLMIMLAVKGHVPYCASCGEERAPSSRERTEARALGRRWRWKGFPVHHRKACSDPFYDRFYRTWHITKRVVFERDGGRCRVCRKTAGELNTPGVWPPPPLEYDHIVEVAAGGDPLDPENVQLLCRRDHARKTSAFLRRHARVPSSTPMKLVPLEAFA